jgi:hypothetical protein
MRRALLLIVLASGAANADTKKAPTPAKRTVLPPKGGDVVVTPRDNTPHREGEYGGVAPGGAAPKDKPTKPKRPPPKGTLSWIGFEAKDGGAQLFFQSVAPFNITQKIDKNALVVHLNLNRLGPNTWRQVDTRFFDNPLSFILAKQSGGGIDVRITFKNPKDMREGTVKAATADADGMYYAYVSFPEGTDAGGAKDTTAKDPER